MVATAYEGHCGLLYCIPRPNEHRCHYCPAPATNVSVDATVLDLTAKVQVSQSFSQTHLRSTLNAIYVFPLDASAAVTGFEAHINGRVVKAVLKSKEDAQRTFQQAVAEDKSAFLLEQRRPDIFAMNIGNLLPGDKVTVVISYVAEVTIDAGRARFYVPTAVAPRYTPANTVPKQEFFQHFSPDTPKPFLVHVNVALSMSNDVQLVESPTHQMKVSIDGRTARATLELPSDHMNRDIVILYASRLMQRPMAAKCTDPFSGLTTVALSMVMNATVREIPSELIFLVDCSGSMQESDKIGRAREAMLILLRGIPQESYFNIVLFGSSFQSLNPSPVLYDDNSLASATSFVRTMNANMGGTELHHPLNSILSAAIRPGYARQLFVLTDGQVSNESQVISLVASHSATTRVFSLGIGDSASHHLVTGLARAGRGSSRFITSTEPIGAKVAEQLRAALQATIDNVTIDWDIPLETTANAAAAPPQQRLPAPAVTSNVLNATEPPRTQQAIPPQTRSFYSEEADVVPAPSVPANSAALPFTTHVTQCPRTFPAIVPGDRLVAYAVIRGGSSSSSSSSSSSPSRLRVRATTVDGPLELTVDVASFSAEQGAHLLPLATRALVRELQDSAGADENSVRREIESASLRGGIASSFTSWVAVDEMTRTELRADEAPPSYMQQPRGGMRMARSLNISAAAAPPMMMMMAKSAAPRAGPADASFGLASAPAMRRPVAASAAAAPQGISADVANIMSRRSPTHDRDSDSDEEESAKVSSSTPSSAADKVSFVQLILMQRANGLIAVAKFVEAFGKSEEEFAKAAKDVGVTTEVFVTFVWAQLMRLRFPERNSEWALSVAKAERTSVANDVVVAASAMAANLNIAI